MDNTHLFDNTLTLYELQDLKTLNNDFNNYSFFKTVKQFFTPVTAAELQDAINTIAKFNSDNKRQQFETLLSKYEATDNSNGQDIITNIINEYNTKFSNTTATNNIPIVEEESEEEQEMGMGAEVEEIFEYPANNIRLIQEKYKNNNLIERTFYRTNNANEVAYREIFTTSEANNKYISKIVDKNYKELGERVYADRVTINNNNNNDQLKYMTIYENGNTWSVYEQEQDYVNIVNNCLKSKNQNMIGDNIAGLDEETVAFNTAVIASQRNANVVIYNKSNMQETVFNNGWFKDKTKTTLLEGLGLINTNDRGNVVINGDYQNKLILVPVSQDGHATTMIVDTHDAGSNDSDKIKLGLFDSSFYHKLTLRNKLDANFGDELSKTIKLVNKTNIFRDTLAFLADKKHNSAANFGYLQENGTCAYWQNAFVKVIATSNTYTSFENIQKNIENGTLIAQMCVELDKVFAPRNTFKMKLENNDKVQNFFTIKIKENMYLYINKNTCHKNQFVNLAKLQQRLGYPQELNCNDFNEEIHKQKVLRKRLQAIENYNNLVEYYKKAKKQVSRRDFITAELKDIQQKISDRRADNDLIKRTKSLLGLQKNYDTNALNNDGQDRAFILDLIDNKIKAQPLTIIEEKISQLEKNIKEDVKKYRQNILDYINATEHQTNDIIKFQTQNRKLEQNIAKELNGFNRFCRNKLKLSKEDIAQFKKRTAQHQTRSQLQNTSATEQQYQQIQPQTHHNMTPQQQEPVQNQHNFSPEFIKIKKMLANKLNEDETKNVKQNSNIRQKTGIIEPGI